MGNPHYTLKFRIADVMYYLADQGGRQGPLRILASASPPSDKRTPPGARYACLKKDAIDTSGMVSITAPLTRELKCILCSG